MKKLLLAGGFSLIASSAMAANGVTIEGTVNVDGERECVCELSGFGTGVQSVNFGQMDNVGNASTQTLTGLGLFCNLPSTVTIESTSGYLQLNTNGQNQYDAPSGDSASVFSNPGAPGFASGLDYQAEIVLGGSPTGLIGDTSQIQGGSSNAVSLGTIPPQNVSGVDINFDTIPGTLPLIAGDYSDTLTVSITPQSL